MEQTFETPDHVALYVEIGSGSVDVRADTAGRTTVAVSGKDADDTTVESRGDRIVVIGPQRRTGFFGGSDLHVQVSLPSGSDLTTKLGSADLVATGTLGTTALKTGSGDIRLDRVHDVQIESGSGDVTIDAVEGDLRAKAGSGDIALREIAGAANVSTGSGDVEIGSSRGDVQVKTGSGDLRVREPSADVSLSTASGNLAVDLMSAGQLAAKNVSGDIRVGIPGGLPVWTDVSSLSGSVRSTLEGAGQPAEGQDYLELRAKTVSGDIYLEQR